MTDDGRADLFDRWARRLADLGINRAWWVAAAAVVLMLAAATGLPRLEFSNNYRVFFSPDNPELLAFEEFEATYTKNDNILFVIRSPEEEIFSPRIAGAIEKLTAEAWKIPYAIRVDSVSNFQHSWADGDELTVEDLVRGAEGLSAAELERRQGVALAEPLLFGNLLSADAVTTGVNVTLQYPGESLEEVPQAAAFARELRAELQAEHPDLEIALSGVSMLNNAFAEAGQQDSMTLMPAMFLVLIVFTIVVLRSVVGTLASLAVVIASAITALGLAGWLDIPLTPVSVTAPVIILTLAIADSVHILTTMLGLMREGTGKIEAIRESLRINLLPVTITSITTIVGFLALNFSDAPPFRHLGNITAMGIAAAFTYSITLLPALLRLAPVRVRERRADETAPTALARLADWVTARHRPILFGVGGTAIVLVALVPTIDLNDEWVKYFDDRIEFRRDAEFGMDHLNGIYLLEFSLDAGEPGGISDPAYLTRLDRFTDWLRDQPEVTHVYSYADVIKRLNKNMNADDPAFYRIPEDRDLAAQYLLLYELSLPYGLDLNDRIGIDKQATRVTASVSEISTARVRELIARSEGWLADRVDEAGGGPTGIATGATVMFSRISERNINSMLRGNMIAVGLIGLILVLSLRSWRLGLLSIVPNALPVLVSFGLWAILVRQVGMAAATVTATSLGIVVDDTVHLLSKFVRARREKGYDRPSAVRYAFETTGRAIVSTTIILSLGFGVLALSTFRINAQMGLLTAITIVVALVIDFVLLPSLLMIGHRADAQENRTMNKDSRMLLKPVAGVMLLILAAGAAQADSAGITDPTERGFAVAARSDRSDRGFGDSEVELEMILRNKAGKTTTRKLTLATLEVPDESVGDKSLIIFDSPRDIEGTALLSHAQILDPDNQWLYLPALSRVKRISSVNKSGPFVGSEFAFEDFTSLELNKYEYRWVREEACGDMSCDVVERLPRYEHSGYTRQLAWVDQTQYQIRKVEFYDRRGDLLKTLEFDQYREYDGVWRAHRLAMVNHQTGKSTDLIYSDYRFGTGLGEGDFVKGVLQRIR